MIYEDEAEMLNGNGGSMPPQPSVPVIEGVSRETQVGRVEESSNAIMIGHASFDGRGMFVHACRRKWHLDMHVMG